MPDRRCIRGFNASASLKPVKPAGERFDADRHPRLQRLGLIEATAGRQRRDPAPAHPRLQRLGLIEALASGQKTGPSVHGIRGFNASASLKRGRFRAVQRLLERHPRLQRLGLIEAPPPAARRSKPGKHPRLQRLGLIEATSTDASSISRPLHPRLQRLGLIEAPRASAATRPRCGASEASTPRPH